MIPKVKAFFIEKSSLFKKTIEGIKYLKDSY